MAIEKTPGVCGGRARIAGTRIPVWVVVEVALRAVAAAYPKIRLSQVVEALEYAYKNQDEVQQDIRDNRLED